MPLINCTWLMIQGHCLLEFDGGTCMENPKLILSFLDTLRLLNELKAHHG